MESMMLFLQRGRIFLPSSQIFGPFWPENFEKSWQHLSECRHPSTSLTSYSTQTTIQWRPRPSRWSRTTSTWRIKSRPTATAIETATPRPTSEAQFLVPDWGEEAAGYGVELLHRPASLCTVAWRAGTITRCHRRFHPPCHGLRLRLLAAIKYYSVGLLHRTSFTLAFSCIVNVCSIKIIHI